MVTGVQIHNWGAEFDDESPNLEFVWPCSIYVVIRGERTYLDVNSIPVRNPYRPLCSRNINEQPDNLPCKSELYAFK